MSGTIRSPTYLFSTQWVDSGTAARDTPSSVRDLIESVLADYQTDQPANVLANGFSSGAVVGASGGGAGTLSGTLPTGAYLFGQGNLVAYVAAIGISPSGYPYWDLNLSGTTSTTGMNIYFAGSGGPTVNAAPITVASYTFAAALSFSAGSLTNITAIDLDLDTWNASGVYVSTPIFAAQTVTATLTEFSAAGTPGALSTWGEPSIAIQFSSGVAVNVRLRIANPQLLLTSTAASYTALATDRGTTVKINSVGAFTVDIPGGVLSGGQCWAYRQVGAGQVTFAPTSGAVFSPPPPSGVYTTRQLGSRVTVTADTDIPNLFWLDGDLT